MRTVYYYYKDDNMDQTLGDYLTNALASARNEVPGAPLMRAAGRRDWHSSTFSFVKPHRFVIVRGDQGAADEQGLQVGTCGDWSRIRLEWSRIRFEWSCPI
jgi:hypothetical protein